MQFVFDRALQIVQNEEYLTAADTDIIRRKADSEGTLESLELSKTLKSGVTGLIYHQFKIPVSLAYYHQILDLLKKEISQVSYEAIQ